MVRPEGGEGAVRTSQAPRASGSPPTVVFLGTSLTEGLGLESPDQAWPSVLARRMQAEGYPHAVRNAGVSGDTSAGGLRRITWLLQGPVDVLVVELGANDALRGLPVVELERNLRAIVREARSHDPGLPILLVGMEAPPNMGGEYTTAFRDVYTRLAQELDLALVPFLLAGVAGYPSLNQSDGIHPTAQGHEVMAETVWPHLQSLLEGNP